MSQTDDKTQLDKTEKSQRIIFVHSKLDEYGLDPYEFRLYAHIARRGTCFASLQKTAGICGISIRRMQYAFKVLCEANMISKTSRGGRTSVYKLTAPSEWKDKKELAVIRERLKKGKPGAVAPD